MYGPGTLAKVIGEDMNDPAPDGDPLLKLSDSPGDCGKMEYKQWENAIVFGSSAGSGARHRSEHIELPAQLLRLGRLRRTWTVSGCGVRIG